MKEFDTLSRRRLVAGGMGAAGLLAAGLIAIGDRQGALAQDSATPEATTDEETDTDAGVGGTDIESEETASETADSAASAIERASAAIDSAQLDRDAVAGEIDTTTVDALLAQAGDLRDRAQATAEVGDAAVARKLARAADSTAKAAADLVKAQLVGASLPSQEAPASRTLAGAYERIVGAGEATVDSTDGDVAFALSTAQSLYQTAFDLFGAGSYGQAAATATVAAHLARIATDLALPNDAGRGLDRPGGQRGRSDRRGGGPGMGFRRDGEIEGGRDDGPDAGDDPVEAPEPNF